LRDLVRHLGYRPPYDWDSLLGFLERRTIGGVESCADGAYRRTVRIGSASGVIAVAHEPQRNAIAVSIPGTLAAHEEEIVVRVGRMFDVDADSRAISRRLRRDPLLAPLDRARPGIRVPGAWDAFELGVRAVVGQQVSVAAARSLLTKIATERGERMDDGWILFPDAARLAEAPLGGGMPRSRIATLHALAAGVATGAVSLDSTGSLQSVRGIGEWTASYVAMRVHGDRDAFLSGDLVLRKMAGGISARELSARAEAWRPYRAYACLLLWRG
jgi:AraC family transcriptional regulator of adaptative response / DNA-3-methyladenine glycosylase II